MNPDIQIESSDIEVDLSLDHRRKGLLWYATYDVNFQGRYVFSNPLDEQVEAVIHFEFPTTHTIYDDFEFRFKDVLATPRGDAGRVLSTYIDLSPREETEILVNYKSRGLDYWKYSFANGITTVKNFILTVNTDFDDYNFPSQTVSATKKIKTEKGWTLQWQFSSLVSDFDIGVEMPNRLNPGPLASRMSYFAPVSLFFFFTVLVVLVSVRGVNLHPTHFIFLGAAFFSFHLLFAYLVDHVVIELAFLISAIVSLGLVVGYLWRITGRKFALREAGVSQLLFLVLFSYAFFFEGYTGLVVTIGAVITLGVLMHLTVKVDWSEVFRGKEKVAPQG